MEIEWARSVGEWGRIYHATSINIVGVEGFREIWSVFCVRNDPSSVLWVLDPLQTSNRCVCGESRMEIICKWFPTNIHVKEISEIGNATSSLGLSPWRLSVHKGFPLHPLSSSHSFLFLPSIFQIYRKWWFLNIRKVQALSPWRMFICECVR